VTRTLVFELNESIFFAAPAHLAAEPSPDHASEWELPTQVSPYIRWVAGDFVESGNPNSNGQYWTANDLALGQYTITYSPLNLLHRFKTPVGFFHSTRRAPSTSSPSVQWASATTTTEAQWAVSALTVPGQATTTTTPSPSEEFRIQFLAGMWTHIFPEEFSVVQAASEQNRLFASMECVGSRLHCMGDKGCDKQFDYFAVDTHCAHLRERTSVRHIVDPIFRGGGLIVPPVRPGWKEARATVLEDEMASLISKAESAQAVYRDWVKGGYDLSASEWELLMAQVVASAR
jgi:hypothetical protein